MIWDEFACEMHDIALCEITSPQFVGLECEIESVLDHGVANGLGWNITTDGSLRNNGFEYISKPVTIGNAFSLFEKLHGSISLGSNDPFSQRTSIHVHANCANMTLKQVKDTVQLYALYEEAFFLMCSPERRDNIHCTPLTETYLPSIYGQSLGGMVARWHKYTALNIKPISKQGTIEFRHMQGHNDTLLLNEWLVIISNLLSTAKQASLDTYFLTEDKMRSNFISIFGQSRLGNHYETVRTMMNNQIIDLKLAV
jgi:hypothetical protein